MVKKTLIFLGCFLCFSAASSANTPNRSALIIGIGSYNGPASDLLGVPADVESAKLIAKAMGVADESITVIRDSAATKKNILEALSAFSRRAADGGRVFIYFSGHGTRYFSTEANGCVEGLLSYDYDGITHAELAAATKGLTKTADKSIFMVDACHSGGVLTSRNRSLEQPKFVAKFAANPKTSDGMMTCAPTNYRNRSLFNESQRLDAIKENVVFISAAKPDEVSWDEGAGRGGSATQAIRNCLLGNAKDVDKSGGVSLEEIRQCAQSEMDQKLPGPIMKSSTVTIFGNRNLIPVISASTSASNVPTKIQQSSQSSLQQSPQVSAVSPPIQVASISIPSTADSKPPEPSAPKPIEAGTQVAPQNQKDDLIAASLATLKDIESQRNPMRVVNVKANKQALKINKDYLDLEIKSSHDGYLYLALLGSDKKSFYILYPNKLDSENFIKANESIKIPRKSWQIKAAGPIGANNILVMVSDSPRDLSALSQLGEDSNSPFVYALNTLPGRKSLVDYMVGRDKSGTSERFGAKILSISEVK